MVNDITIITGIITVFILVGTFVPIVQDTFNVNKGISDVSEFQTDLTNATGQFGNKDIEPTFLNPVGSLSIFDVLKSILLMFFWTFGALPLWLDLIFLIFRAVLVLIIARNIWVGGGG